MAILLNLVKGMHLGLSVCLCVCLSGRVTQKLSLRLTLCFYKRSVIPVARPSCKRNLLKDSSPLQDRTEHAIKVCHDVKHAMQKCVMTSQVRHSERRSAIVCIGIVKKSKFISRTFWNFLFYLLAFYSIITHPACTWRHLLGNYPTIANGETLIAN